MLGKKFWDLFIRYLTILNNYWNIMSLYYIQDVSIL